MSQILCAEVAIENSVIPNESLHVFSTDKELLFWPDFCS